MNKTVIFIALSATFSSYAQQSTPDNLERISIISSRVAQPLEQITSSVSILDQQKIDQQLSLSLADLMRVIPGVNVSNSGGLGKNTSLRIRGEESFRTRLYIDGVELSDPSAPQVAPIFDDLLSLQISRVEVLRGSQGLSYGADAGGVISVKTQSAISGFDASLATRLSRYNTHSVAAQISGANQGASAFIGASHLKSDGFNSQTADITGEKDGYENTTLHFNGSLALSNKLSAQLVVRNVKGTSQYDGCYDNLTFATTHNCSSESDYSTIRASLGYEKGNSNHQLSVKQTDVDRDFFANDVFGFTNQGRIREIDYLGNSELKAWSWVYGAQFKQERITADNNRWQKSLFVETITELSSELFANASVRIDDNETFGKHLSYRTGLARLFDAGINAHWKLRATWGTGFRAPSLFEQNYNDGPFAYGQAAGLALQEETSQGGDVAIEYIGNQDLHLEAVVFTQTIDNEIIFDPIGFQGYLQNGGSSHSKGVELSANIPLNQHYTMWANYTYNDSKDSQGEKRLRRPRHITNLGLSSFFVDNRLSFNVALRIVKDAVDIAAQPLDDYQLATLSASYRLNSQTTVKLGIENAFNEQYEEVLGYNTAQRDVSLSVTFKLP